MPAGLKLPADLLRSHLNLLLAAAGPPSALATSAVAKLGDFTITAAPIINLTGQTLSGAVSLRHPNAIAAMKLLELSQGCTRLASIPGYPFQGGSQACLASANDPALAFPGPGSLSLRARFTASPATYGLNDFILSAGLLNASGQLLDSKGRMIGQINAGTLAFPAIPAGLKMPGSLPFSGSVGWRAGQILYAGHRFLGASAGTLTLAPNNAHLTIATAILGNGNVSGSVSLQLSGSAPPTLSAKLMAQNIEADALKLPQGFPLTLSNGQINATASLTAKGYEAKAIAATLGGTATITVSKGILNGLSLPKLAAAMGMAKRTSLSKPLSEGATPFATMTIAGTISQGNCSLTQALLKAPSGTISATGDIDLFDSTLALKLDAAPALNPPLTLTTRLIGPWDKPGRRYDLRAAANWTPARK